MPTPSSPGLIDKLRDIQSITDAALSRLGPAEMLEALVERVRQAFQADTAAVLLLEPAAGQLVATAASGLEEEVRQGVRIPVGKGFAGRIAAEDSCVILDEVDHTKVVNPILLDKGIRSLMGAPLRSDGAVIGVMHVGTLSPRAFTAEDADLLQIAADRAAITVQALSAQIDRAAALALQRSLLPSALPVIPGLQMAARLVPGVGNIGGDWYDVFTLPSGQMCAVIGDVAGSGLKAAVIMGRLRSALRAYALETADPADMLDRLERKMAHFEPDAMATMLCVVFSPGFDQVTIANAGHLPPILAVPGDPAAPAPIPADALIGAEQPEAREVSVVTMPPGAVLCLYTDGLVERRDWSIDDGIDHLCKAIQATEPEVCCATVMAAMADVSPHSDDVALLVFRRLGAPQEQADAAEPQGSSSARRDAGVRWSGRHAVVTAPAEIDVTTAPDFQNLLASVAGRSPRVVTVDMSGSSFCDSAGLNVLTRLRRQLAGRDAELRIVLGISPVRRIVQLSGIDRIIEIFDNVEQSLAR
jgi:sigma-B regulation protein RsbU (phosphoserine phosphatase)